MERKEHNTEPNNAVSPVIGVILMVAITVILAAVIGTFVLGLGNNVNTAANAGVTVDETPNESVTLTIVSPGNIDSAILRAPSGNKSAKATDTLGAGTKVIIQRGGFPPSQVRNVSDSNRQEIANSLGGISKSSVPQNLVGTEECLIRHSSDVVRELPIGKADIGCSAQILESFTSSTIGIEGFAGDPINYEVDAEYQLIGVVDGGETIIKSVQTSRAR